MGTFGQIVLTGLMGKQKKRPVLILVLACSAAGVVLGGTASWAESNRCLQDPSPTTECLTKNPKLKTIEGMSVGLVAGFSAALGAAWRAKQGT